MIAFLVAEAGRAMRAMAGRLVPVLALAALAVGATMVWSAAAGGVGTPPRPSAALRPPPGQPPVVGSYRFARGAADGSPATFDGCGRLLIGYEAAGAPYDAARDVARAAAELSVSIGRVVDVVPWSSGAQITIAWAPDIGPGILGRATVNWAGDSAVAARVELATDAGLAPGFGSGHAWGPVVLHELGHAVGLAHMDDETQVMFPVRRPEGPTSFGVGDLSGLAQLGSRCRRPSIAATS